MRFRTKIMILQMYLSLLPARQSVLPSLADDPISPSIITRYCNRLRNWLIIILNINNVLLHRYMYLPFKITIFTYNLKYREHCFMARLGSWQNSLLLVIFDRIAIKHLKRRIQTF